MLTYATQNQSAALLFQLAAAMHAGALRVWGAAKRLDRWLERRRAAATDLHDLHAMSEHELLDIGLTRVDIPRMDWRASNLDTRFVPYF